MFCPNCGAKNSSEQKFCRSCGMNLQPTVDSLKAQFGTEFDANTAKADRFFNQLGKFAFGGFGGVVVIGLGLLFIAIFNKYIGSGENIMLGVFLILFFAFAILSLIYVIYASHKESLIRTGGRRLEDEQPESPIELAAPDTGKLLNNPAQMPIAVPSVVDETTDLLQVEAKTRKL